MDWMSSHAAFVLAAYLLSFVVLAAIAGRILSQKWRLDAEVRAMAKRDNGP